MNLQYSVVFERTPNNYCAYVPDLPGCIATGHTWEEIQAEIQNAIAFHIAGMQEDGDSIPGPRLTVTEAAAYHSENAIAPVEWPDGAELVAVIAIGPQVGTQPTPASAADA